MNIIELSKILTEKNINIINNNNSGEFFQSMTLNSFGFLFNKKYIEELEYLLEDKYNRLEEERIHTSVTVGEVEELFSQFKNLYEAIIDSIIQSFYIHKKELSENNILTTQMPLIKYHQMINNKSLSKK